MTIIQLKRMLDLLPQRQDNTEIKGYNWATGESFEIDTRTQEQMEEDITEFGYLYLDQRPLK